MSTLLELAHLDLDNTENALAVLDHLKKLTTEEQINAEFSQHDTRKQNIFHVCMKNVNVFKACYEKAGAERFAKLFVETDDYGDNVLHQLIEFGRDPALAFVIEKAEENKAVCDAFFAATAAKNLCEENPAEILEKGLLSATLHKLDVEETKYQNENPQNMQWAHGWEQQKIHIADAHQRIESILTSHQDEIKNELTRLKDSLKIEINNNDYFDAKAQDLFFNLERLLKESPSAKTFFQQCKSVIEASIPELKKNAIGMFMRFLNTVANMFGCRKAQHQNGQRQQALFKGLGLFNVSTFKKRSAAKEEHSVPLAMEAAS